MFDEHVYMIFEKGELGEQIYSLKKTYLCSIYVVDIEGSATEGSDNNAGKAMFAHATNTDRVAGIVGITRWSWIDQTSGSSPGPRMVMQIDRQI